MTKVIIDTDPGVDDILAHLLAFTANPEDLEVLLVSLTFGNVDVESCLRNVVSLFHIIEREQEWRRSNNKPEGFHGLKGRKPVVAMGAREPLAEQKIMADFFHGVDGLGGIHGSHPHLSPSDTWRNLFDLPIETDPSSPSNLISPLDLDQTSKTHKHFIPSTVPSHKMILRLLSEHPKDTISIVAIGPLTNLALAAAEDPAALLRAKEVIVMGGAIDIPGNITPLAEFNTHADTVAFARVLALTSPHPKSTMPPWPPGSGLATHLPDYPYPLDPHDIKRRLKIKLLPLDVTTPHVLTEGMLHRFTKPLLESAKHGHSPLAEWLNGVLAQGWEKTKEYGGLSLHDPLAVWQAYHEPTKWQTQETQDIRVESMGQWTRGACVIDRRGRPPLHQSALHNDIDKEITRDRGGWLDPRKGNRIDRVLGSPVWRAGQKHDECFAEMLMRMIFPE